MLKKLFVHIVLCSDVSYYTGVTNDVSKRLNEHETGIDEKSYTYSRRPLKLVYQIEIEGQLQAIAFEKKIKGWSRKKKEALIRGDWDEIKLLAVCKNETTHKSL